MPWKDFVSGGYGGYEVSVSFTVSSFHVRTLTKQQIFGNYVDGTPIAGLVQVSQLLAAGNGGIIKSLSFDGKITLESGQVVRINDPNAVYSAGYTAKPAFTADDQNPSISGKSLSALKHCEKRLTDLHSLQWIPYVCATLSQRS